MDRTAAALANRTECEGEHPSRMAERDCNRQRQQFAVQGANSNESISNIWNHPKTSAAGLLIAVVTIAGVLSQQGVTLGRAGTGTVVTLVSALASAFLGLLAKDPGGRTSELVGGGAVNSQAGRVGTDCAAAAAALHERLLRRQPWRRTL